MAGVRSCPPRCYPRVGGASSGADKALLSAPGRPRAPAPMVPGGRSAADRIRACDRDVAPSRAMSEEGFGQANLPYGVFRARGGEPRVGVRYGYGVLDLAALARGGLRRRPRRRVRAAVAERVHGRRGRRRGRRTRARVRDLLSGVDAEPRCVDLADVELLLPDRGRRLRRLLVLDRPRLELGADLPARGRAAAAPVAPPADRLPRALGDRRGQRHAGAPAARPAPRATTAPGRSGPSVQARRRARARLRDRHAERASASRSPSAARSSTSSASCCSTTGARATCRRGSRGRSGPFLGKSFATSISAWVVPMEALAPFRVARARRRSPSRRPTCARRRGRSTSTSSSSSNLRRWRARARATCTGASPSRSRT